MHPSTLQDSAPPIELADSRHDTPHDTIPAYLTTYYWWAYVHPRAVKFFERQWLVSLIVWGNYGRLRDAALAQLGDTFPGATLPGATLQVACAYGNLSTRLARIASAGGGSLDIVDVLPIQLQNVRRKLLGKVPARLLAMNAARLQLPDSSYDRALLFFLLHEQPPGVRNETLREVFRVVKPGGKIVIVDYARPQWWNPLRYLWPVALMALEPFALDLWRDDVANWPPSTCVSRIQSQSFFGGLYKMTTFTRR